MAEKHVFWRTAQGAETSEQGFFESAFGGFGATREFESMPDYFAGATVDDGHKDAPTIFAAVDQGKVGSPSLIWSCSD